MYCAWMQFMYILIDIVLKPAVHISWLQTGLFVLAATRTAHQLILCTAYLEMR